MDSVHDLGGVEGFGPIPVEVNEPVFHYDWEAKVMGMRMLMGAWRKWNLDAGRHSVEVLPPADYLSMTYYEKWLASLTNLSAGAGLLSREEIATGVPDDTPKATPPIDAEGFRAVITKGRPSERNVDTAPAFVIGDQVRTKRFAHSGHTRLPRYVRDRVGTIELFHGGHVLPDISARMEGDAPEHLYTVRFTARELWGSDADPNHSVTADLWESYLDRA